MEFFKLPCGIRVLYHYSKSPISCCGFAIDAGTRDELPEELGMAHFVEHMLFKGTKRRRTSQVIGQLENIGGQLDAYTEKEETFVYSVFPTRYTMRAIDLLSDIIFHSTFPQEELEKERLVILDEIESYEDSPSELIYDDFEGLLYPNHPIGRAILGEANVLETFDSNMMKAFVQRNYTAENLLFFYAGRCSQERIIDYCNRCFDPISIQGNNTTLRTTPTAARGLFKEIERETSQAHCLIGCEALPLNHNDRFTLALLNNILGGPMMSSHLNLAIREKRALAYTVESSTTAYSDTGLWSVYFGCDHNDVKTCMRLVDKELEKMRQTPLSNMLLARAKRQLLGQLLIASQSLENNILSMAKIALHENINPKTIKTEERIREITAADVQTLANRLFNPDNMVKLLYI